MNTGIADGHNLGWKLSWVIKGWATDALLDPTRPSANRWVGPTPRPLCRP